MIDPIVQQARQYHPTWRSIAAPIIAEVISTVGRDDPKALRRALREAYPWGDRHEHPRWVWCREVHRQLRKTPPLPRQACPTAPG